MEISGPPGTPKETVATNIVTSFVEAGEGVIFVGEVPSLWLACHDVADGSRLDTQNMTSPASLNQSLQS